MIRLALLLTLFANPALAQQAAPDPVTLQRAVSAIQQQRNAALDQAASFQIEVQRLTEENAKLKAEIEALKNPTATK